MISDKDTASKISQMLLECSKRMDDSIVLVKGTCSPEEFAAYRKAVGKAMGEMLLGIMNPIYQRHPDLKPKELR